MTTDFDEAMAKAARAAADAVDFVMGEYKGNFITDEDDITGGLFAALGMALRKPIGGLHWKCAVARHRRGKAAEEKILGADLLIHVKMNTNRMKYSKGTLVQSKRSEPGDRLSHAQMDELVSQCDKMLSFTSHAMVFKYSKKGLRAASAMKIKGSRYEDLHSVCDFTAYRFFLNLFRCSIGDERLTSALASRVIGLHPKTRPTDLTGFGVDVLSISAEVELAG